MPDKKKAPYLIGVTGTIGSGKSAVGKILSARGITVLDTDMIVHDLLSQDTATRKAVSERFGAGITEPSTGAIDRPALGQLIFADDKARRDLEAIVHPAVIMECRRRIQQLPNQPLVAILAPLLFEANLKSEYNETWTIYTAPAILKQRLQSRDNLSDAQVESRLRAQWSQEKKASAADSVIDNSGTVEETAKQIDVVLEKLKIKS